MNRSLLIALCLGVAMPAFAQQPLQPQPMQPPPAVQPQDPYAQYGEADDEDDSMDVSYDISTDPQEQQYDDGYDPNAYQQFESQLSPYGAWEEVPDYGRVWVPSTTVVGYDFTPYASGGHFVMSDYGWTWVSDWDWGWAPFHYGRWMVMGGHGWCWIPGTTWAPAWVNWRWGGGYVGWAPMAPRGVVVGAPRGMRSPWHFTVAGQLGAVRPHFLPARVVPSVWRSTTAIHNVANTSIGGTQVRFNAGPPSHLVAAATGRALAPTPLRTVAPRALPHQTIAPHVGTPLQQRPWMQGRAGVGTTIARTSSQPFVGRSPTTLQARPGTFIQSRPQPLSYRAPAPQPYRYAQPQPYRYPQPQPYRYAQPQPYRYAQPQAQYHYPAPAQSYHPAPTYHYAQPMQTYHAPPAYHYSAPAPVQSFHAAPAPAYHYSAPAPAFHSAPSYGGGFHGGGGGFHGGGRR